MPVPVLCPVCLTAAAAADSGAPSDPPAWTCEACGAHRGSGRPDDGAVVGRFLPAELARARDQFDRVQPKLGRLTDRASWVDVWGEDAFAAGPLYARARGWTVAVVDTDPARIVTTSDRCLLPVIPFSGWKMEGRAAVLALRGLLGEVWDPATLLARLANAAPGGCLLVDQPETVGSRLRFSAAALGRLVRANPRFRVEDEWADERSNFLLARIGLEKNPAG